tara:strand:- start:293 stop:1051 length:759 start_codon:yes stop_codon:yes gene_type:complete
MLLGTNKTKITTKAPKARGYIMYKGPSMLTGAPIVVIATMSTNNVKTGDMVQTWILDANTNPVEAVKSGDDVNVCGTCPHRGTTCYVNVGQAPNAVYKGFKRGIYPMFDIALHGIHFASRKIRLGAYGDPAAAPYATMALIASLGIGHTGYTHQINHKGFDKRFLGLCMVSADTPKQAIKYQALGAKTFRVALVGDSLAHDEVECLADTGQGIQCADCGLCDGTKKNVAITVHGKGASKFKSAMVIPSMMVA